MSKYKKTRAECAANASETQDGTYISGHMGVATLAFVDESTGRWYFVDICEACGHPDVCFADNDGEAKHYPVVKHIGGLNV